MASRFEKPYQVIHFAIFTFSQRLSLILLAACLVPSSHAFAQDDSAGPLANRSNREGNQGLLSRLRGTTVKPKDTSLKDSLPDPNDANKDRRWSGSMRVPLQPFTFPWSSRASEPKSSIQDPIDLPSAIQPRRSLQAQSDAIGSGVARRSEALAPTPQRSNAGTSMVPPLPSSKADQPTQEPPQLASPIDSSSRKELRVYEAAPSPTSIDSKNTSRRSPTIEQKKTPAPAIEAKPTLDLPSSELPSIDISPVPKKPSSGVPAINASARSLSKQSAPLDVRVPQLRLRVDGPQSIEVGKKTTYTIHATNEGESELQGLIIRASTPKGVTIDGIKSMVGAYEVDQTPQDVSVLWELESLAANDSKSLEMQIEVLEAEQFAINLEWSVAPSPTQMNIKVQQPKLELDLSGPVDVQAGVPQKYRVRVKNSGNANLSDLNLSLQTETTSQYESILGDIPAGAEKIVDIELTFEQPGLFPIVATAKDQTGKLQQRQRVDVQVQELELTATWHGPEEFIQGTQADYELVIQNTGGVLATNLDCTIDVPQGIEILELPQGVSRVGNQVRWSIQALKPNSEFKLPLRCDMVLEGNQTLLFQSQSNGEVNLQTKISTTVEAIADLELSVVEPQAPAPVGTPVVYEIHVVNRGAKAAENVRVLAQFSEGIEPLRIEGHPGRIVPGQALFEELAQVPAKQTVTLKVICQASKNGVHRFRAAVQSPTSQEDLLEEGSTRFVGGPKTQK
ncbi:MAG: hypothetical protein LW850_17935 [Planctomycetaceae bacterium]|jgi:hypothetical protein|nr:hypothetical protein [Planctomycetaceae bacterium]